MAAIYGGLCAGAKKEKGVHRRQQLVIHQARAGERAGMHRLESDRFNLRQALQGLARAHHIGDALADG